MAVRAGSRRRGLTVWRDKYSGRCRRVAVLPAASPFRGGWGRAEGNPEPELQCKEDEWREADVAATNETRSRCGSEPESARCSIPGRSPLGQGAGRARGPSRGIESGPGTPPSSARSRAGQRPGSPAPRQGCARRPPALDPARAAQRSGCRSAREPERIHDGNTGGSPTRAEASALPHRKGTQLHLVRA